MNGRNRIAALIGVVVMSMPEYAQRRPLDLKTDTDYPNQGDPVTLSAYWEGLAPQYGGRFQLRYQTSRTNPPTWMDVPGSGCAVQPCAFRLMSPTVPEFRGQAQLSIFVRAMVRDTTTGRESPSSAVKTVTWVIDTSRQQVGGYFLTLTVNGQAGCTIKARQNAVSYSDANCRNRGPLDIHQAGTPVVRLRPDGRGRFIAPGFSITAMWGGLPPGTWYARITHGNYHKQCEPYETTCTLQVPQQTFDGDFIGRANTLAGVMWVENTRDNPSVHGWPSSLGAEVGVDFMR